MFEGIKNMFSGEKEPQEEGTIEMSAEEQADLGGKSIEDVTSGLATVEGEAQPQEGGEVELGEMMEGMEAKEALDTLRQLDPQENNDDMPKAA